MRIAYICCDPGVPVFGNKGCSVHVQEVLREFVGRGFEIDLFAMRIGGEAPSDLSGVEVHRIEVGKKSDAHTRERRLLDSNDSLKVLLAEHGPYDLVYERYSLFAYAAMEYARNQSIAGVLEVNSPLVEEQLRYRTLLNAELAEQLTRRVMVAAGVVIAVSEEVAQYVGKQRLDQEQIHVIPNGVDIHRFKQQCARDRMPPSGSFTIGFVGTLKPWHGVASLIEALSVMNAQGESARLLIVGDGPERGSLESQASKVMNNGTTRVEFIGAVHPREVPLLLARMDVAVAPYPEQEHFYFSPLKLIEYMAAGLPTVASRIGQIANTIVHEETGLLYQAGDVQGLASALIRLKRHPKLRISLGTAARAAAESRFTWATAVNRILAIASSIKPSHRSSVVPPPHFPLGSRKSTKPTATS